MERFLTCNPQQLTRELVVQFLPIHEINLSSEVQSRVDAFNAEISRTNSVAAETERAVNEAVSNVTETDDANKLLDALDAKKRHLISDAQALARLWTQRLELLGVVMPDRLQASEVAQAEGEQLLGEVTQGLRELGFDTDRTTGFNMPALARHGHSGVRAKFDRAGGSRSSHEALRKDRRRTETGIEQAKAFVRAIADRIASGKV